jgi:signal transduction histidine kinase
MPEVETHLYRVAQEALNNVVKHASARHVSVVLERHDDRLVLIIEDDGRGFDVDARAEPHGRGLGLVGMRERAEIIGGSLEIESTPGKGTTIFLQVPDAFVRRD